MIWTIELNTTTNTGQVTVRAIHSGTFGNGRSYPGYVHQLRNVFLQKNVMYESKYLRNLLSEHFNITVTYIVKETCSCRKLLCTNPSI